LAPQVVEVPEVATEAEALEDEEPEAETATVEAATGGTI
jgi:hypothetical protein